MHLVARRGLALSVAIAAAWPATAAAAPIPAGDPDETPHRVIVRLDNAVRGASLHRRLTSLGLDHAREIRALAGLATVEVPGDQDPAAYAKQLARSPGVRYAEPDVRVLPAAVPNDPFLSEQYALHNVGQNVGGFVNGTPDADIDAPEAWNLTTGSEDVIVAVLDTGFTRTHPELAGRLATNPGEQGSGRESNGIDDDGNGFVDDWRGWDFVDEDPDPADLALFPHGTAVAGVIAAQANNGLGVSGVAPGVRILPLRVGRRGDGAAFASDIIEAYGYAAKRAKVVNLSFALFPFIQGLRDVMAAAPNVLFVVSAGNSNEDVDTAVNRFPCGFGLPNIVCVAATDHNDAIASFSSMGATTIDLAAPGVGVITTSPAYERVMEENFEQPLAGRWTVSGTNASWDLTAARKVSGASSLTDSPGGNYAANTDSVVTRTASLDLRNRAGCRFDYAADLDLEPNLDVFGVEAANGAGPFQFLGGWSGSTGDAFSALETDTPGDGLQDVRVRLSLRSNGSVQGDGVYLDDFGLSCLSDTYSGRDLLYADGTSFSGPLVAGIAALVYSLAPDLTAPQVRAALRAGVDPIAALQGKVATGGRANAAKALGAIAPLARTGSASSPAADQLALSGVAVPRGRAAEVWFEYGSTTAYGAQSNTLAIAPVVGEQPVSVSLAGLARQTTFHYRLVVRTAAGVANGADQTVATGAAAPVLPGTLVAPQGNPPVLTKVKVTRGKRGRPVVSLVASERVSLRAVAVPKRRRLVSAVRRKLRAGKQKLVLPKLPKAGTLIVSARDADGEIAGAFAKLRARATKKKEKKKRRARAHATLHSTGAGTGNPNYHLPPDGQSVPDPTGGQQPPKFCLGSFCVSLPLPPSGSSAAPLAQTPGRSPIQVTAEQAKGAIGEIMQTADEFLREQKKLEDARKKLRDAESRRQEERRRKQLADISKKIEETGEQVKDLLDKLNPENWPTSVGEAAGGLRQGQLEHMPQFAKDLNKIANYDEVLVEQTDRYYASGGAGNVDIYANLQYPGKTYTQLTREEKVEVGRLAQRESGALNILLDDTRAAGKSATHVTFGR